MQVLCKHTTEKLPDRKTVRDVIGIALLVLNLALLVFDVIDLVGAIKGE